MPDESRSCPSTSLTHSGSWIFSKSGHTLRNICRERQVEDSHSSKHEACQQHSSFGQVSQHNTFLNCWNLKCVDSEGLCSACVFVLSHICLKCIVFGVRYLAAWSFLFLLALWVPIGFDVRGANCITIYRCITKSHLEACMQFAKAHLQTQMYKPSEQTDW